MRLSKRCFAEAYRLGCDLIIESRADCVVIRVVGSPHVYVNSPLPFSRPSDLEFTSWAAVWKELQRYEAALMRDFQVGEPTKEALQIAFFELIGR